ncbi:MAG: sigma-70 family RNA polymerase sigma factor [Clostridia bacterium]|nr:sigma-70 family RNA polymerase sigma factor [Clostridia bacterium]
MLTYYLSVIDSDEEKQKFTVLYETWNKAMYYAALKSTKDPGLAEDAVQDALMYIAKNIHKIDDPVSKETKAYLLITVESQVKKILRTRREIIDSELVERSEDRTSMADDLFEQVESFALTEAIKQLDEDYRTPLLLKYAKDLSGREIAEITGLTEATVRKRIERAKKMLAEILQKE